MPRSATAGTRSGYAGRLAGRAVRRTASDNDALPPAGRQFEPAEGSQPAANLGSLANESGNGNGQFVAGRTAVALVVEERKVRWTVVDWACAYARHAGQSSLPVVLDGRRCRLAGLEHFADSESDAAWYAMSDDLYDLIAERICGWGLDPVIHRLDGRTAAEVIGGWGTRPTMLITRHPGRLSWPGRQLVRRLQRDWPVTLVE